ncbi:hypothetical protein [Paenibacillus gallinarum]|uniref:56B-like ribbon-helix-helix domain-containing protein n=1 Tax=Paenibacillus gallinarum TaxID=2762232 RepID=A0ABR8T3M6_9BACL|nr:hypothetical protein [Paenibacillus gallinarum]MBD7970389.1 hypothetical protein [Paenibacillus gallinarum]
MSKKQTINELLQRKENKPTQKSVNTETNIYGIENLQIPGSTEVAKKKKKATFDLDPELHTRLKIYAAQHDLSMVEIVENALQLYFEKK